MLKITFRVNLIPPNSGLFSNDEILNIANTIDFFVPSLLAGENIPKVHNELFTLTGQKAHYLKNLINTNKISYIEIYNESFIQIPSRGTRGNRSRQG